MKIGRTILSVCMLATACVSVPGADPRAPATAEPSLALEPPTFRLPRGAEPLRYDLDLTIDPDLEDFSGRVGIDLRLDEPVEVIWLNARELAILSASVESDRGEVQPTILDHTGDGFVGFQLSEPLESGTARIEIDYRGRIHHDSAHSVYSEIEGEERYVYTFFEPVDARRAFPSFDEPSYKVPWRLTLTVPPEDLALANTPIEDEEITGDGMKRVRFAESKPLPSYLVAFIVGPFDLVDVPSAGENQVRIRIAVPRGRAAETAFAVESTPRVVELLEEYFEMPYPFEKLDVAVVPRYWGTMEHPGLVAMGQPLTLIKPEEDGPRRRQAYVRILAHELAHYWFGDLVTMEWWDDLWLNESLATWLDEKITDQYDPSWNYPLDRIWSRWRAMKGDELTSTRSLRQPVTTADDVLASFDNEITYFKGAEVIGMLEGWLGEERFRKAIQHYLHKFAWQNATSDDLVVSLAEKAGDDAARVAVSFIEQAGFPMVSVGCSESNGPSLELRQRRFLSDPESLDEATWTVPVCIRYETGGVESELCRIVDQKREVLELQGEQCPAFVIGNDGQHGYYRTRYDDNLFGRLVAEGIASASDAERLGVVLDYRAFAWRGDETVGRLLDLIHVVSRHSSDPAVVGHLSNIFDLIARDIAAVEDLPELRELAEPLFLRRMRQIGWGSPEDTDEARILRSLIGFPAATLRDPELARMASDLLPRYLEDRRAIDSDAAWAFLASVASLGREVDYERILEAARSTEDRTWRNMLLTSLAWFQDEALTQRTFELILSDELDRRDTLWMSYYMMRRARTSGKQQVYEFIVGEWDRVRRDVRDEELHEFFRLPAILCDRTLLERAERDLPSLAANVQGGEYALSKGLEEARRCVRVRQLQHPNLRDYLDEGRW